MLSCHCLADLVEICYYIAMGIIVFSTKVGLARTAVTLAI